MPLTIISNGPIGPVSGLNGLNDYFSDYTYRQGISLAFGVVKLPSLGRATCSENQNLKAIGRCV